MKKIVSILVLAAMLASLLIAVVPVSAADEFQEVGSADAFAAMKDDGKYKLTADISITKSYGTFKGVFDGNGKTITIDGNAACVFTRLDGATIKDLVINGFGIVQSENIAVGALAPTATNGTYIENVENNCPITIQNPSEDTPLEFKKCVGGIVAETLGSITFVNCRNNAEIKVTSCTAEDPELNKNAAEHCVGGILGGGVILTSADFVITLNGCVNTGALSSVQTGAYIGGMIGHARKAKYYLDSCVNKGTITLTQQYVNSNANTNMTNGGGMIGSAGWHGKNDGGYLSLNKCVNEASAVISCTNAPTEEEDSDIVPSYVALGGMTGRICSPVNVVIALCRNDAEIRLTKNVTGWSGCAGIVATYMSSGLAWEGTTKSRTQFLGCVNNGKISGMHSGGIVGAAYQLGIDEGAFTKFDSCLNAGDIDGVVAGGIIGQMGNDGNTVISDIQFINCMNKGKVSGDTYAAGVIALLGSVGTVNTPVFDGCSNKGDITITGTDFTNVASGVIGQLPESKFTAEIIDGDPIATVTGEKAAYVVSNCANSGNVNKGGENSKAYDIYPNTIELASGSGNNNGTPPENDPIYVSKVSLIATIDLCSGLIEKNYVAVAWTEYTNALNAANEMLDRAGATQEDIDTAEKKLSDAHAALSTQLKNVDYSRLDEIKGEFAKLDKSKYKSSSWSRLVNALEEAEKARATGLQSEYDNAMPEVEECFAGLTLKNTNTEQPTTDDPNSGDDSTDDSASNATEAPAATEKKDEGKKDEGKKDEGKKKKGCKSAVVTTTVVLGAVLTLGTGIAFKKKEN